MVKKSYFIVASMIKPIHEKNIMQRISLENMKGLDIHRKRITFIAEGFFFISKYVFVFIKDRMWIILKDVVACIEGNETLSGDYKLLPCPSCISRC